MQRLQILNLFQTTSVGQRQFPKMLTGKAALSHLYLSIEAKTIQTLSFFSDSVSVSNNISWAEAVSQNVDREGSFEPFVLIHRTKDYTNSGFFSGINLSLFSNIQVWMSFKQALS